MHTSSYSYAVNPLGIGNCDDLEFSNWIRRIDTRFIEIASAAPLFNVEVDDLFQVYLSTLPANQRQYHNCHECRRFINRYGTLVVIDPTSGKLHSAIWDETAAPDFYEPVVAAMRLAVERAQVAGVFLTEEKRWGVFQTGQWTHFAVNPPARAIYKNKLLTAFQAMAERREDHKNVLRGLSEFSPAVLDQALNLLKTDALYRAEKVLGPVEWLRTLHAKIDGLKGPARTNLVWLAVAIAPAGFCHPRSSMAGTLLEDIAAGMPFDVVSRRFAEKMHPLAYQRPQAAPSAQNIKRGEEIVEKLGIAPSLQRRYARVEDITDALWRPSPAKPAQEGAGGVFGHLKAKNAPLPEVVGAKDAPPVTMTWEKFARTVLPDAVSIEFKVPRTSTNYLALVTAVHPDAPPILQWDLPERRNPVSHYVWNGGSSPSQWGLSGGSWHPVSVVAFKPSMWHGADCSHQGKGVVFVLDGAKESRFDGGLGLFPEILKTELREIRSTIEAFSRAGRLENTDGPMACGYTVQAGNQAWADAVFRVTTRTGTTIYKLDRWD